MDVENALQQLDGRVSALEQQLAQPPAPESQEEPASSVIDEQTGLSQAADVVPNSQSLPNNTTTSQQALLALETKFGQWLIGAALTWGATVGAYASHYASAPLVRDVTLLFNIGHAVVNLVIEALKKNP